MAAEYLTPALLVVLIAVIEWRARSLSASVSSVVRCHLTRHPEDLDRFTLGG